MPARSKCSTHTSTSTASGTSCRLIAPTYRDNQMIVNGKIYGLPDDGDVFVFYYRKDIFNDPANQSEFKAKFGYDLAPPKTWKQFAEIGQFLTDKYAPKMYGAAFFRQPPYAIFMFEERFRNEGGRFFDGNTMKATINSPVGVKVLTEMRAENKFMPPGVETVRLRREPCRVPCRPDCHDDLLAALRALGSRLRQGREGARLGAEIDDRRQGRLRSAAGRPSRTRGGVLPLRCLDEQAEGRGLSLHPMAQQRRDLDAEGAAPLRAA